VRRPQVFRSVAIAAAAAVLLPMWGADRAVAAKSVLPSLKGPVTVVASAYELPGTTGWDTAVVFSAKNPSRKPLVARFRVTVRGANGTNLAVSSGNDLVTFGGSELREVVTNFFSGITGEKPASATVTFYEPERTFQRLGVENARWTIANVALTCPSGQVECQATGDLTWHGKHPQKETTVSVVARDGAQIVAAGDEGVNSSLTDPGTTAPFKVLVTGLDDSQKPRIGGFTIDTAVTSVVG
jgi:hypothetical protein